MNDTPESNIQPSQSLLELAALVAQSVEIQSVLLVASQTSRSPELDPKNEERILRYGVSEVRYGKNEASKEITVLPTFRLELSQATQADPALVLKIMATLALIYSIESFEEIADENLNAFSLTNGIFNAWPYWREFVQSTTARMGVDKPIILPVYRIGQNPFDLQQSNIRPKRSESDASASAAASPSDRAEDEDG